MRILVTGSRNWRNIDMIREALMMTSIGHRYQDCVVIQGDARGADTLAKQIAQTFRMQIESYPANWSEYHRAAGPIRNQQMVDTGADICLAFLHEGSKGTADCMRRAAKADIPVKVFKEQ